MRRQDTLSVCRCEYCRAVNEYIPDASEIADAEVEEKFRAESIDNIPPALRPELRRKRNAHWDRVFHREMNRLTREAGVRSL
jgi:hypothetical protein